MVDGEDLDVVGPFELLTDPGVPLATDVALVEVGVAGVDGHDGEAGRPEPFGPFGFELLTETGEPLAEEPLEVDVADVARIVVAGDHHLGRLDPTEPLGRL